MPLSEQKVLRSSHTKHSTKLRYPAQSVPGAVSVKLWRCSDVVMYSTNQTSAGEVFIVLVSQCTKEGHQHCFVFRDPFSTQKQSLTCNPATLHLSFWVVTLPLKTCDRGINLQRKFILFRQILSKSFWLIGEDQDWVPCRYFERGTTWMWSHSSVPNSVSVLCEELESPTETLS